MLNSFSKVFDWVFIKSLLCKKNVELSKTNKYRQNIFILKFYKWLKKC